MNRYEADWFCHGEWRHLTIEIIANSAQEVEDYISEKYTKREWRSIPYARKDEDSLKIKSIEPVTLPYELRMY